MFFSKRQKEIDREIMQNNSDKFEIKEIHEFDIKVDRTEQIYSSYSLSDDKLSIEFKNQLFEQCKNFPFAKETVLNIHTKENLSCNQVESAIKKYCQDEYLDAKKSVKQNTVISLVMTLFGILALTLLFTLHHLFNNIYITTIVEIAAWVFIWEAVDCFFLQRPKLKAHCLIIQKMYTTKVKIKNTTN